MRRVTTRTHSTTRPTTLSTQHHQHTLSQLSRLMMTSSWYSAVKPLICSMMSSTSCPFPPTHTLSSPSQVEYAGVNFLDIYLRNGNFPLPSLPAALGVEAAGAIVALPTDQTVLNSDVFKKRGYRIGGQVACVSHTVPPMPQPYDTLITASHSTV